MMTKFMVRTLVFLLFITSFNQAIAYIRPAKGRKVILHKRYTKERKIELGLLGLSTILNEAYVQTNNIGGSLGYFFNDEWGLEIVGGYSFLNDRPERTELEGWVHPKSNRYSPIFPELLESQYSVSLNVTYTPFYAKQLILHTLMTNFDIFFTLGGGVHAIKYYPSFNWSSQDPAHPPDTKDDGSIDQSRFGYNDDSRSGKAGRDHFYSKVIPVSTQMAPSINLGFGQRYFFWNYFNLRFDIKDYILFVDTSSGGTIPEKDTWLGGYMLVNHVVVWLGLGIML